MRHRKAGRRLGRTSSHRKAMIRNMVTSLMLHERIVTTTPKAKEVRRYADKMMTLAKRGDLHARRLALSFMQDKDVVPTWLLSGGLSSLKKEVFEKVTFNEKLKGACPIEDVDFYSEASKHFRFALAPKAQALHNMSPVSRDNIKKIYEH